MPRSSDQEGAGQPNLGAVVPTSVQRCAAGHLGERDEQDWVAVEEPLEIRVHGEAVASTMRTPGHDRELALGLLFSEGRIRSRADVSSVFHCGPRGGARAHSAIEITPSPGLNLERDPREAPRLAQLVNSACGVCGRDQILALWERCQSLRSDEFTLDPHGVFACVTQLGAVQAHFGATGGTHAAAVVNRLGEVLASAEDVGRHNAVDKVVGALLLSDALPARSTVLVVSSRASFEIVQKACMAGIPFVICLSAPTSLAIDLATEFGMTLVGFAKADGFNVYAGAVRLRARSA